MSAFEAVDASVSAWQEDANADRPVGWDVSVCVGGAFVWACLRAGLRATS